MSVPSDRPTAGDPDRQAAFVATLVDEWVRAGVAHAVVCPGSRSTPSPWPWRPSRGSACTSALDERSAGFTALGIGAATGRPGRRGGDERHGRRRAPRRGGGGRPREGAAAGLHGRPPARAARRGRPPDHRPDPPLRTGAPLVRRSGGARRGVAGHLALPRVAVGGRDAVRAPRTGSGPPEPAVPGAVARRRRPRWRPARAARRPPVAPGRGRPAGPRAAPSSTSWWPEASGPAPGVCSWPGTGAVMPRRGAGPGRRARVAGAGRPPLGAPGGRSAGGVGRRRHPPRPRLRRRAPTRRGRPAGGAVGLQGGHDLPGRVGHGGGRPVRMERPRARGGPHRAGRPDGVLPGAGRRRRRRDGRAPRRRSGGRPTGPGPRSPPRAPSTDVLEPGRTLHRAGAGPGAGPRPRPGERRWSCRRRCPCATSRPSAPRRRAAAGGGQPRRQRDRRRGVHRARGGPRRRSHRRPGG